jgi:hypothetical protein
MHNQKQFLISLGPIPAFALLAAGHVYYAFLLDLRGKDIPKRPSLASNWG